MTIIDKAFTRTVVRFPHLVNVDTYRHNFELRVAIFNWCDDQFGSGNWMFDVGGIRFANAEYATLFALRWAYGN